MPILILFVLRIIVYFFVSIVVPRFIPYLGFFPYRELLADFHLPQWLYSYANFDGIHYLLIAKNGYSQYEQAFFPLYPLLIHIVSFITRNELISGLLISNISIFIGLFVFYKYLLLIQNTKYQIRNTNTTLDFMDFQTLWTLFFLLLFPTSFFFGAVYTEGLFFLLLISSLYFLEKKNYKLAGSFAVLSSLTRLIGVFLIIPFALKMYSELRKSKFPASPAGRLNLKSLFLLLTPLLGLLIYTLYLWRTTGDPLFFLNSQPAFGANRSSQIIFLPQVLYRYIKIFLTAGHDFRYFVAMFEFVVFCFVFGVLTYDLVSLLKEWAAKNTFLSRLTGATKNSKSDLRRAEKNVFERSIYILSKRLGLNLFSFANLLTPTLTGTLSSIPRYTLFSISFFIALASIKNTRLKIAIAFFFFIIHIITLGLFIQGYFIS
jgi:hypothetical protein